jgi:glycosyltransferase involved in cell wall biosynthesis
MAGAAPRVSIIMPTYNWSSVLPYSIGSAQAQTFPDFELLVIGDGCTDDSAEVVRAIGDARVQWIGLDRNSGHQSTPNNEGLRRARGEIIAYLGHDDLWLPDHLAALVRTIDDGADLAHAITRVVSPNAGDDPLYFQADHRPGQFLPPSAVAHRRTVVERIGGWRDHREISEVPETDLWRRAHEAGFRFVFVPRVTLVKLPASYRRNVYRERPCHEQAEWLERIRRDSELGDRELVRVIGDYVPPRRMRYAELVGHLWRETWRRIARRLSRQRTAPATPGSVVGESRRMKGLGPAGQAPAAPGEIR